MVIRLQKISMTLVQLKNKKPFQINSYIMKAYLITEIMKKSGFKLNSC